MSQQEQSAEKTELPTPKRMRDAREKGQVSKSKEVISLISLLSLVLFLFIFSEYYMYHLNQILLAPNKFINQDFLKVFPLLFSIILEESLTLIIPILAIAFFSIVFACMIQVGFIFSFEPIKFDFNKINPVEIAKKQMFSKKALFEFMKSVMKVVLLSALIIFVLYVNMHNLMKIPFCNEHCIFPVLAKLLREILLFFFLGVIIIAIADYFFERSQYIKELMMTKDEVKREHKEMEGDPQIKSKRKQVHREMANSENTQDSVKKSNVVVTNPTHLAIGLYYEKDKTPLPIITCKGKEKQAEQIKKYAEEFGIPVLQKVPLARALMSKGEIYEYIPSELIQPVAEVMLWLERVKKQKEYMSEESE